jgi:ABC-type uncharacterized transport system substrate-binding protein
MFKKLVLVLSLAGGAYLAGAPAAVSESESARSRIVIVSSYHREYLWSQDTNAGVVAALLDFGYLDSAEQGERFWRDDYVESSTAVVRKLWMDTKRRNKLPEIADSVARIIEQIDQFEPEIILLGDDNAANYIGSYYLDTELPVVFWGINGTPMKYGLLESMERPGHNVTGIYQAGYLREGLVALKTLLPEVRSFAVLSDDSPTGRSKAKEFLRWSRRNELPLELVEVVVTNDYEAWKRGALDLRDRVDVFFVLNHNTLQDADGKTVEQLEAGRWYLTNIQKPDISHERHFVKEGILFAVEDSGYKQGYEAVRVADRILREGQKPGEISVYAPERGPFIVNSERARALGIEDRVVNHPLVEETIDFCLALQHPD